MGITPLNTTHNGDAKRYTANPDYLDQIESILFYAKEHMTSPCSFHLLSHVSEPENLDKSNFLKNFSRALKRQYKTSQQQVPETLLIYSIEFKMTDVDEINDTDEAYISGKNDKIKLPFLHIHVCIIADCNKTIPQAFNAKAQAALNEIAGLSKARYYKSKARNIYVLDEETGERKVHRTNAQMYKSLKKEFDDVYDRVKYLAKLEQKDPDNIPFRQKFGCSRLPKLESNT